MNDTDPPPPHVPPPPDPPDTAPGRSRGHTAWYISAVALAVLFGVSTTALVMVLRDRSDDAPRTPTTVATTVSTAVESPPGADELSPARAEVLRQLVESSRAEGVVVDEACLREVVTQLSDDDARLLAETGIDDAAVSEQGDELAVELFGCISFEWYLDEMVRELERRGLSVDRACLESELTDFDFRELGRAFREDDEPPEQLATAGLTCSG